MPKYRIHSLNIKTYLEIINLAIKHGKKAGDSLQEEFEEVLKKHPEKFELIGTTDKDVDLLTGDLRERGFRVWNIREIDRNKGN